MQISDEQMTGLLAAQQGELDAVVMYMRLAELVDERDAKAFRRLAADEHRHAKVFEGYTDATLEAKSMKASLLCLMYRILGKRLTYSMIAKGEYAAVSTYESLVADFPEVESVMNDEQRHGDIVSALMPKKG